MFRHVSAALILLGMVACSHMPASNHEATRWQHADQLVVVTIADWNSTHGKLRTFERENAGGWREIANARLVVIGRAGAAWGIGLNDPQSEGPQKREGDGRSPAGVFGIGEAFGYAPTATTGLAYEAMDADDWCVDVDGSPLYNRIVDAKQVGAEAVKGSSEPMRRDLHADGDQRYRLGFVIEHNQRAQLHGGSCIFAHIWKSPDTTTAGCTAMAATDMEALQAWLDRDKHPAFVLLPISEYHRLQADWQLPAFPTDGT